MNDSGARELLGQALDAINESLVVFDRSWRFVHLNRGALAVIENGGNSGEGLVGRVLWDMFPGLAGSSLGERYRAAMDAEGPTEFEEFSPVSRRWFGFRTIPSAD